MLPRAGNSMLPRAGNPALASAACMFYYMPV